MAASAKTVLGSSGASARSTRDANVLYGDVVGLADAPARSRTAWPAVR